MLAEIIGEAYAFPPLYLNNVRVPYAESLEGPVSWLRVVLLVLQGLGAVVVAVLCLPTIHPRRSRS